MQDLFAEAGAPLLLIEMKVILVRGVGLGPKRGAEALTGLVMDELQELALWIGLRRVFGRGRSSASGAGSALAELITPVCFFSAVFFSDALAGSAGSVPEQHLAPLGIGLWNRRRRCRSSASYRER